jgi:hypothetical protein
VGQIKRATRILSSRSALQYAELATTDSRHGLGYDAGSHMGIAEEAIAAEVNGDEVEKTEYERRKDDRIRELAKKLKSVKLAAQSL